MDPLAIALCGVGAVTILYASAGSALGTLLLLAGLYGVHRVLRSGATRALLVAPPVLWLLGHFWTFVPEQLESIAVPHALVFSAPEHLAAAGLIACLGVVVLGARARIGTGLSTVTLMVLGLNLLLLAVPTSELHGTSFGLLVEGTERGWTNIGRLLAASCLFLVGVGPVAVQPLPRRAGAIAGAIGALLLAAGISGVPRQIGANADGIVFGMLAFWLVANVLCAVGLGAMARAGAKPAGWIGVALVVLGIFGLVPAVGIFEKTTAWGNAFTMSTPFGLLGIGLALFGWKGAPLESLRKLIGVGLMTAFAGGTLAWMATYLALARVTRSREPWALAQITSEPLAEYGLVLWAALLVYLAAPPQSWRPRA